MAKRSPIRVACSCCGRRFAVPWMPDRQPKCAVCRYGPDWREELIRAICAPRFSDVADRRVLALDSAPAERGGSDV